MADIDNKGKSITDIEVEESARYVISRKGGAYSFTEFNCAFIVARQRLINMAASDEQIAKFEELVQNAPVKGGKFNAYRRDWNIKQGLPSGGLYFST